jgi:hypothetical protein
MGVLTGQFLLQVLKVLVAVLVHANKGSGFGITCNSSALWCSLVSCCAISGSESVPMFYYERDEIDQSVCEEQLKGPGFHERTAIWWA